MTQKLQGKIKSYNVLITMKPVRFNDQWAVKPDKHTILELFLDGYYLVKNDRFAELFTVTIEEA